MTHSPTAITSLLLLLLLLLLPPVLSLTSPSLQPACATPSKKNSTSSASSFDPSAPFLTPLRSALDEIQKLISIFSTFSGTIGSDLRLPSAISDCLDLLDLTSDELTSTISTSQPSPDTASTGNLRSDVRSWLSAAVGNQDTCEESLEGTSSIVGSLVGDGLETITSLVADSLGQFAAGDGRGNAGRRRLTGKVSDGFPEWVSAADRRLLQAPAGKTADAVVAQDGSGQYATVGEAVEAAPMNNTKRYVIHVKRGVYRENVEIKKNKWNIMLIGDGMAQTIISGSRNFVDGWTTFRSATFGEQPEAYL